MKIIIDPACNFLYASYYIKGLINLFGNKKIKFSSKPFKTLRFDKEMFVLNFITVENLTTKKYCLDFSDSNERIYITNLKWCDIYGKVNLNPHFDYDSKIVLIQPNTGINYLRIKNKFYLMIKATYYYLLGRKRIYSFKKYISCFLILHKRQLKTHKTTKINNNYIFYIGTLWKGEELSNTARINFIRACKSIKNLHFEGGLIPDKGQDITQISDVILHKRIPFSEYLKKVQNTTIVFNAPAYSNCLGWKLPEFLMLNKIILSLPMVNRIEPNLINLEHIVYAENNQIDMASKIEKIINDKHLQNKILKNSNNYWINHMSPKSAVKKLLNLY